MVQKWYTFIVFSVYRWIAIDVRLPSLMNWPKFVRSTYTHALFQCFTSKMAVNYAYYNPSILVLLEIVCDFVSSERCLCLTVACSRTPDANRFPTTALTCSRTCWRRRWASSGVYLSSEMSLSILLRTRQGVMCSSQAWRRTTWVCVQVEDYKD